ncbi:MAG: phosphatidylserine decarboxylase [Actinomycetota bacterium]|jgi:phosphatidylserine decarboxylase|nr:phosphatidylserine decarboxylase [Rubrobacter sp.]MDQ3508762.1 phosphatidylserine decarboxylase [Actinomycetota bacterium]
MTRRTWDVAKRYFFPALVPGLVLLALGKRVGFAFVALAGAILYFFRDPERSSEPEPGTVYSAADGLVTDVEEVEEAWLGGKALRISVFLSLHNVHVNRSPMKGKAVKFEEIRGGYAPALFEDSGGNYRHKTLFDGEGGRFVLVQKAGMIARRITPWIEVGDEVEAGERIGVIHFGSRTDILLPADEYEPLVEPKDKAKAGFTPVARRRRG